MTKEALKLALEALEVANSCVDGYYIPKGKTHLPEIELAITAIKEALANEALEKMAENARELGLDYEPEWTPERIAGMARLKEAQDKKLAQPEQEPVATDWERIARVQDAKLRAMCNEAGGFEKLCEVMDKYERTTPPQRKPLTAEMTKQMRESCDSYEMRGAFVDGWLSAEAAHGIKGEA